MTHLKRLIAVFIMVLTAFLIIPKGKAESNKLKPYGDKDKVYKYDDVNEWSDLTRLTGNVDNLVYDTKESYGYVDGGYWKKYSNDTKITKVIPFELFVQRGTHIHMGLKYGFFVQTQKGESYWFKNEELGYHWYDDYNIIEVFIFKIDNIVNTKNCTVETRVEPVYSGNFVYHYSEEENYYNLGYYGMTDSKYRSITYFTNYTTFENHQYERDGRVRSTHFSGYISNKDKYELEAYKRGFCLGMNIAALAGSIMFPSMATYFDVMRNYLKDFYLFFVGSYEYFEANGDIIDYLNSIRDFSGSQNDYLYEMFGDTHNLKALEVINDIADALVLMAQIKDVIDSFKDGVSVDDIEKLVDYIYEWVTTGTDLLGHVFKKFNISNFLSNKLAFIGMIKDVIFDFGYTVYNSYRCLVDSFDYYETNPDFKQRFFGYSNHNDYQLRVKKDDKKVNYATITTSFKPVYSTVSSKDILTINNTLYFYDVNEKYFDYHVADGEMIKDKKFYDIRSSYKIELADPNEKTNIDGPTWIGGSVYNKDAIILTGEDEYKLYITPKVTGKYSINLSVNNGLVAYNYYKIYNSSGSQITNNFLEQGKKYEIRINAKKFSDKNFYAINYNNANYTLSAVVQAVSSTTEYEKTFYCKSTGYYYVEIDAYWMAQRNYILLIDSIQVTRKEALPYCGGVYRYVKQTYNGSRTQVTTYMWKVYFYSGEDYTINYSSNTSCPLKIYKA